MSLPAITFDLHPMDVYNICFALRRRKEKASPRSLRYILTPGEPVRMVLEPWNQEIVCPRSIYTGNAPTEVRVWGRRRIMILERLIPIASKFTVHLLGTGLPSFYVAHLNDMTFTLGLSGWTANDWSRAGNFDLLAPRTEVDNLTKQRVFNALKETWRESPDALAKRLGLDRSIVLGALSAYTQGGRAIYDLNKQVYRVRELSREPLELETLRFTNDREASASRFLTGNAVQITSSLFDREGTLNLQGTVRHGNKTYTPSLQIDRDERIIAAECTCNWHQQHKLLKGPCEHILALRMQHTRSALVMVEDIMIRIVFHQGELSPMNTSNLINRFQAIHDTGTLFKSNQHSPTSQSIKFIEKQLGIILPKTFTELASRCLTYTEWFAGMGQDYEWDSHILTKNREYHNGEEASLPKNLILFTQGYDLIYDCFDLNNLDENGNASIVYCYLLESDDDVKIDKIEHISYCFDTYLDRHLSRWEKARKT